MPTAKSVIDIDVNDAHFKRFLELYHGYQEQLEKLPGAWKKVGDAAEEALGGGRGGAGRRFFNVGAGAAVSGDQKHEKALRDETRTLERHDRLWERIGRSTKKIHDDIFGISRFLIGGALGLGLAGIGLGIGGLFGLMGMGRDITDARQFALGNDTTIGQRSAFENFQGQMFGKGGADQFLSSAFLAKSINTPQGWLAAELGVNTHGSTWQVANRMLRAIQARVQQIPQAMRGNLNQMIPFLSSMMSQQSATALAAMSPTELNNRIREGDIAARRNAVSDAAAERWTGFVGRIDTDFKAMMRSIERTIANSGLLPAVERLMNTVSVDFGKLANSPLAHAALNDLGKALDSFTKYLTSGKFTQAIKDFGGDVKDFAHAVQLAGFGVQAGFNTVFHPVASTKEALTDYLDDLKHAQNTDPRFRGGGVRFGGMTLAQIGDAIDKFLSPNPGTPAANGAMPALPALPALRTVHFAPMPAIHLNSVITVHVPTGSDYITSMQQLRGGTP